MDSAPTILPTNNVIMSAGIFGVLLFIIDK